MLFHLTTVPCGYPSLGRNPEGETTFHPNPDALQPSVPATDYDKSTHSLLSPRLQRLNGRDQGRWEERLKHDAQSREVGTVSHLGGRRPKMSSVRTLPSAPYRLPHSLPGKVCVENLTDHSWWGWWEWTIVSDYASVCSITYQVEWPWVSYSTPVMTLFPHP